MSKSRDINVTELERSSEVIMEARKSIQKGRIDNAPEDLENIMRRATKIRVQHKRTAKIWFDEISYRRRKEVLNMLHNALERTSEETMKHYAEGRREYKKLIQEKKRDYYEEQGKRQIEEEERNPYLI
ncbi:hypothetical protein C0J52_22421 [Blattella germanica]|nr:hypothetical protein C0J52_22421 [Blattella germanica]